MDKLPMEFLNKMRKLLGSSFDGFLASYNKERAYGLRVNTLKIKPDAFKALAPFPMKKVPWAPEGYYYEADGAVRPGKHPYHEAGLYYIQEPSAMVIGELADPKPGERVLDLCAAPGGKSTHLAAKMQGSGLLVSNEPYGERAKVLSRNMERMGVRNGLVTCEMPDVLAKRFPAFFDRIIVDAPCSGEGMFRKDQEALSQWSLEQVDFCAKRQLSILKEAAVMLKPEGILVYSTCTFSPEENEGVISCFIKENKSFEMVSLPLYKKIDSGRPDWIKEPAEGISSTIRLWPHHLEGEGHFAAVLKKSDGETGKKQKGLKPLKDRKVIEPYKEFEKEYLSAMPEGEYLLFKDQLYLTPPDMVSVEGLKTLRPGLHLGVLKKNRFEPSHSLALALKKEQVKNFISLKAGNKEIEAYLRGEALKAEGLGTKMEKGWQLVLVDGYSLGFGKSDGQTLKNHYPKGLRWHN